MRDENKYIKSQVFASDNSVKLFVMGEIGWDFTPEYFIQNLSYWNDNGYSIEIHFYSCGGDLIGALAVYDYIIAEGIKVVGKVYGMAASACTVITSACTKCGIASNAFALIHNAIGGHEDLRVKANESMINIYVKKTGKTNEEVVAALEEGDYNKWMSSEDAVSFGLFDEIVETKQSVAASVLELKDLKINKKQDMSLIDSIKGLLGLGKDSTETEVTAKVKELMSLKKKVGDLKVDALVTKDSFDEAFSTNFKEQVKASMDDIVDSVTKKIKDKLISEDLSTSIKALKEFDLEKVIAGAKDIKEVEAKFKDVKEVVAKFESSMSDLIGEDGKLDLTKPVANVISSSEALVNSGGPRPFKRKAKEE